MAKKKSRLTRVLEMNVEKLLLEVKLLPDPHRMQFVHRVIEDAVFDAAIGKILEDSLNLTKRRKRQRSRARA